ncbi:SURF1 family cytochrome oxidase biogenesis protein [Mycolicibacterium mengxianglii]|uniref:SURF1 family cytochrome oxidase biogenesis protein n=1 Tax=Mycolicibacterium mengxianglii TaxID=2736649 RepID=UPI0018EF089E|nr:SURF1 family protein [Mycolicibacterium mengxianglii]
MRRWAFLFKLQWLAMAVVVGAFAYLCFTVLAPWQLGKNTQTSRENNQINAALHAEPMPVKDVLPQQDSSAPDEQWREVTATGRYLPEHQLLARLRVIEGEPAFEVLVPFAVDGGPVVLVDRGYVRPEAGSKPPEIAALPPGQLTITARLRDSETAPPGKEPFTQDGYQQVYAIDTRQVSALTDTPLTGSYLQLIEDQPGVLSVIPLPHLDAGPFLSYGIQWIAFGIIAPIGLGYFVYAEVKARRRERELSRAAVDSDGAPASPVSVEDKLANRYGRRR